MLIPKIKQNISLIRSRMCSVEKMSSNFFCKIHRKTSVSESLF